MTSRRLYRGLKFDVDPLPDVFVPHVAQYPELTSLVCYAGCVESPQPGDGLLVQLRFARPDDVWFLRNDIMGEFVAVFVRIPRDTPLSYRRKR